MDIIRKRDGGDIWMNSAPIADIYEALSVLVPDYYDSTEGRYLYIKPDGSMEIRTGWFRDADSGGASSGFHYFDLAPGIAEKLLSNGFVKPKQTPTWGSTNIERNKQVLSEKGKQELDAFLTKQKEAARKMPEPGVHSKFSGLFQDDGYGRSEGFCGELFFDFRTPQDERVRVYPASKRVEKRSAK